MLRFLKLLTLALIPHLNACNLHEKNDTNFSVKKKETAIRGESFLHDDTGVHNKRIEIFESLEFTGDYQGIIRREYDYFRVEASLKTFSNSKYKPSWDNLLVVNAKGNNKKYVLEYQHKKFTLKGAFIRKLNPYRSHYIPDDIVKTKILLNSKNPEKESSISYLNKPSKSCRMHSQTNYKLSINSTMSSENSSLEYKLTKNRVESKSSLFYRIGDDYFKITKTKGVSLFLTYNPFSTKYQDQFEQRNLWASYPVMSDIIQGEFRKDGEVKQMFPSEILFMNPTYKYFRGHSQWIIKNVNTNEEEFIRIKVLDRIRCGYDCYRKYPLLIQVDHSSDEKAKNIHFSYQVKINYPK